MADLDRFAELARSVQGLATVATLRADGTIQCSVVNVAIMADPFDATPALAFVTYGAVKLNNLRARPQLTATVRADWRWASIEGRATLVGPDDQRPDVDADGLRLLLRAIFTAAGGTHDDWDAYDRTMLEQRRTAVFVTPTRSYGN